MKTKPRHAYKWLEQMVRLANEVEGDGCHDGTCPIAEACQAARSYSNGDCITVCYAASRAGLVDRYTDGKWRIA